MTKNESAISRNPVKLIARAMDFVCRKRLSAVAQKTCKTAASDLAHLAEIARLLAEFTDGKDAALVVAGILHDTAQRVDCSLEEIERRFGSQVSKILCEITVDPTMSADEIRQQNIARAPMRSTQARMIMMAVQTSSLMSLSSVAPTEEAVTERVEYVITSTRIVNGCRESCRPMGDLFNRACANVVDKLEAPLAELGPEVAESLQGRIAEIRRSIS